MYSQRFFKVFLIPSLAFCLALGCSSPNEKKAKSNKDSGSEVTKSENTSKDAGEKSAESSTTKAADKEPLVAKGWGTLKGKVTFDGTPPEAKKIEIPSSVKEKDDCEKGDVRVQTWKIGPDKGVGDVVVWLREHKGKYFEIPADQQKADGVVKLDQPHCAFIPHVLVLYPTYYDAKSRKQLPTGQKFEVVNSANFNHNTNYKPSNNLVNHGNNPMLRAKTGVEPITAYANNPDKKGLVGGEQSLTFNCNIHGWMSAYALIFDHPYTAVTTGDELDSKDYGTYEIKKAPAGVEVEVVYWHETMKEPKVLKTLTLKEGDNTEDIKISDK